MPAVGFTQTATYLAPVKTGTPDLSEDEQRQDPQEHHGHQKATAALTLGALGIVFGDIGTSPIYTVQTVFNPEDPHPVSVTAEHVYGIASLIFWSVTLLVTIKYVLIVLRADNEGEGGVLSLMTLLTRRDAPGSRRTKVVLALLGIFAASLFFGDSMITPAISVLSAVEGLEWSSRRSSRTSSRSPRSSSSACSRRSGSAPSAWDGCSDR